MKNILKQYELKEFQFAEGHKEFFVKQALNFFKSGFVEDTFFGSTSENRLYQDYLQRNAVYEGFLDKHFFPNLLQVLSLTNLSDMPPDLAANLCEAVLTSQRFFPKWMADVANFIPFYAQHLQFFSKPQIQMILDFTANDQTIRFRPISPLHEKLLQFHPDFRISYFGFWETLLKRESDGNLKMEHLYTLFHFREFLEPDQTEQLRKFIQFRLATKLDFDILLLYLDSLIFELIAKEEFLPTIHGFIRNQFEAISKIQFKPDGELVSHGYRQGIPEIPENEYWLINSLAELNFKHGLHETILNWLLEQPDLPLSLRWLLNPKIFDYSKFDYYWLFFIESEKPVFEKLKTMKIKELKIAIQRGLKSQFSEKLSKIYFEYFYQS